MIEDMNKMKSIRTSGRLELWFSRFGTIFRDKSVTLVMIALIMVLLGPVAEAQGRATPNGIHAGMFPNPVADLPVGWWWAKDAGAVYQPPKGWAESFTPAWRQTIELSRASGYVFKPYLSGRGGAWCRPERNGKCYLPYIRVSIMIMDFGAGDGAKKCLDVHKGAFSAWATLNTKISESSYYMTRNDPPQYLLESCIGRYRTSVSVVGENGEAPNLNDARYFDALIARRIGGTIGSESKSKDQGVSGVDTSVLVMPPADTSAPGDSASVSPEKALLAVAGGSMVLTLGAFLQLWGMGGLRSPEDFRGALESLFSSSRGEVTETETAMPETGTIPEVEVIPKEPEALVPGSVIQEPVIPEIVIPDPVPSGFEYQGKVWYQPPWDKGGPYWMDKSDYSGMRSMMRQGKEWSDRWGWVDPEEGKAMDAQRTAAWDAYKSDTDQDIKVLTANIQDSREKLAEIQEKQAELERIERLRERLAELERQRELDNSFATQLQDTAKNYVEGVNKDLDALPGDLQRLALDAAREVRDTTGAIITAAGDTVSDLTNGDNWKAVGQAAVDTARDLVLHPGDSSVKVGDVVKDAAGTTANVVVAIASHPVDFAEAVVGIDNWRKALDPNVPVGERVTRALYGAVDGVLNFASGGTKVAVKGMEAGLDGINLAKGAEAGLDAAKAADTAADAAKLTVRLDDPARMQAWEAGRLAGQQKADKLAEALKRGDAGEIKQALVDCQKDKHAIQALNKGDDSIKTAYNQNMKQLITDDVDQVVKEKIAQRYGVDPKDVEVVKPTNPAAKPKIGSDLDFTIKVKAKPGEIVPDPNKPGNFIQVKPGDNLTKDVPVKDAQEIYNRELYNKVTGEPIPTDPEKYKAFQAEADKLAHDMDHVAGHRVGAESYGASQQDLETILKKSGGRFTDPEQAGMVASYKSTHLYQQAENIAKVDPGKAEQLVADGMRQTTKQYGNLIETRMGVLQSQGVEAAVDSRLTKAVEILKQVETKGMAPAKAEAMLKTELHMSKDDVANMLGGQLAKLHMMKPK